MSQSDRAVSSAWIANVAIGVSIVAVGVGTYLLLTSPKSARPTAQLGVVRF